VPEPNGSGRLDRVDAILENLAERQEKLFTTQYLHDERMTRVETLHEENEQRWKEWRKEQYERDRILDGRIDSLVSAIGKLIERMPAVR
jgi:hypothetical protein